MQNIVIVGKPNIGKSTLFNRLTGRQLAVTAYESGTTRDSQSREVIIYNSRYYITDTAGLMIQNPDTISQKVQKKLSETLEQADIFLFMVNGREKFGGDDKIVFSKIIKFKKPIFLIINKIDNDKIKIDSSWLDLPVDEKIAISSLNGRNIYSLEEKVEKILGKNITKQTRKHKMIVLGRPNVGKSSLINALLNEDKMITDNTAGTTRDVIQSEIYDKAFELSVVDTPGIRRKGKIETGIEKFGVSHALSELLGADLALIILDAQEGATRGDIHVLEEAHKHKIPVIICYNKIDLVNDKKLIFQRFPYVDKFPQITISALNKEGLVDLKKMIKQILAEIKS